MTSKSLPLLIKQESKDKIVSIANKMLNNNINLVDGCRQISRLRFNSDNPNDDVFNIFVLVSSDTEDVPLDENVRKNFGSDYLKEKEAELNSYLDEMKGRILEDCRKVIEKFS